MKFTNKHNLPKVIADYLQTDVYDHNPDPHSISATALIKPPQEVVLERRYAKDIEVDVLDRVWALFGTGIHMALEAGVKSSGMRLVEKIAYKIASWAVGVIKTKTADEEEMKANILNELWLLFEDDLLSLSEIDLGNIKPIQRLAYKVGEWTVTGKFDQIIGNKLYDYKVQSVWGLIFGSRTIAYRDQLSIYRWLYEKNGLGKLDDIATIVAICRDWSERDRERSKQEYPETPIVDIPIKMLPVDDTEEMVLDRLAVLDTVLKLDDRELPPCSDEDRWWNAKKKVFNKCAKYCNVRTFCTQNLAEKEVKT